MTSKEVLTAELSSLQLRQTTLIRDLQMATMLEDMANLRIIRSFDSFLDHNDMEISIALCPEEAHDLREVISGELVYEAHVKPNTL